MLLLIDYLLQQCSRRPPLHHCLKIDFSGVATWSTRSRSGAAAATGKAPFISACLLMTQNRNHGDKSADSNAKAQVFFKKNSSIHSDLLSFFPLSSEDSAPESFNKLFIIPKCWWKEGCALGKSGNWFSSILSTPWKHFSLLLLQLQTSYAYVSQPNIRFISATVAAVLPWSNPRCIALICLAVFNVAFHSD